MKKTALALILILSMLTLMSGASAVTPYIDWNSVMNIRSAREIRAHVATSRAPYIAVVPEFSNSAEFTEYSVDFRSDHLPIDTYLCVCNFDIDASVLLEQYDSVSRDYPGVGGYCGFGIGDDGSGYVIMTVWDTYCRDKAGNLTIIKAQGILPENGPFERFEDDTVHGEGCFIHCVYPFDWKQGHSYRAMLQLYGSRLQFYVKDLEIGTWHHLMEFDLGYEGGYIVVPCAFLEDFSQDKNAEVRSMVLYNFRARDRVTNKWDVALRARISSDYGYEGSYAYGSQGDAFYAITTNIPGRCPTPPQNKLYYVDHCDTSDPY